MKKIVIIKLGADGDVLRTLPIAKALKAKYPESEITWITRGDIAEIMGKADYLSEVISLPYNNKDKFDLLYNFDLEDEATELASKIEADKKYGFYSEGGYAAAFNAGAEYYLNTTFDDELKKSNRKTYQEMMFEAAELDYNEEGYEIKLSKKDLDYASDYKKKNNLPDSKIIGIHIGASSRWPSKVWAEEEVFEFVKKASKKGFNILLFGGPNEAEKHGVLAKKLEKEKIKIFRNNASNTKSEFAALVSLCDIMVCSDSFALHVSVGLKKQTVALFFCTSPWEVESYNLVKKIVSPMLERFFPQKMNEFDEELVKSISSQQVLDIIEKLPIKTNKKPYLH